MKAIDELGISPCPWSADDWSDSEHGEFDVRVRDANDNEIAQPLSTYDDARLIAAAPELYEALRELIDCVCAGCPHNPCESACVVVNKCRKALAKASRGKRASHD